MSLSLGDISQLLRIPKWVKNILVLTPLSFSTGVTMDIFFTCLLLGMCFCLTSSSIYLLNDVFDKNEDAKHALKKNRLIASDRFCQRKASYIAICLMLTSFLLSYLIDDRALFIFFSYASISLLYILKLRNIYIIDILTIVILHLFRVAVGVLFITSDELLLMLGSIITFSGLIIFFTLLKREYEIKTNENKSTREAYVNFSLYKNNYLIWLAKGIVLSGCLMTLTMHSFSIASFIIAINSVLLLSYRTHCFKSDRKEFFNQFTQSKSVLLIFTSLISGLILIGV